jgi:hypothetical protein
MSPAAWRYPVTAFDPGARDVFTYGGTVRPRATAFRASRPAPIMTVGFDVFVHDVIAAIATDPVRMVASRSPTAIRTAGYSRSPSVPPSGAADGAGWWSAPSTEKDGGSLAGKESAEASSTSPPVGRSSPIRSSLTDCSPSGKFVRKFSRSASSGTRSWGRRGPATDGTTVARSSSSLSSKTSSSPALRHSPCSFA